MSNIISLLKLAVLFGLLCQVACTTQSACVIDIGKRLPANCVNKKGGHLILVSSGSYEQGFDFVCNNVIYDGVEKNNKITYVSTHDSNFETPEGVRVASSFKDIHADSNRIELRAGWAKTYKLPSGWICGFDFEARINDNSKVLFLFKE